MKEHWSQELWFHTGLCHFLRDPGKSWNFPQPVKIKSPWLASSIAQRKSQSIDSGCRALHPLPFILLHSSPTAVPSVHSIPVTLGFLLFPNHTSGPFHLLFSLPGALFTKKSTGLFPYFLRSPKCHLSERLSPTTCIKEGRPPLPSSFHPQPTHIGLPGPLPCFLSSMLLITSWHALYLLVVYFLVSPTRT